MPWLFVLGDMALVLIQSVDTDVPNPFLSLQPITGQGPGYRSAFFLRHLGNDSLDQSPFTDTSVYNSSLHHGGSFSFQNSREKGSGRDPGSRIQAHPC